MLVRLGQLALRPSKCQRLSPTAKKITTEEKKINRKFRGNPELACGRARVWIRGRCSQRPFTTSGWSFADPTRWASKIAHHRLKVLLAVTFATTPALFIVFTRTKASLRENPCRPAPPRSGGRQPLFRELPPPSSQPPGRSPGYRTCLWGSRIVAFYLPASANRLRYSWNVKTLFRFPPVVSRSMPSFMKSLMNAFAVAGVTSSILPTSAEVSLGVL